jgi:hypothetical protein
MSRLRSAAVAKKANGLIDAENFGKNGCSMIE